MRCRPFSSIFNRDMGVGGGGALFGEENPAGEK